MEPTGRKNKNVIQIVQLQLGSKIMINLEELLITLSRCEITIKPNSDYKCWPPTYDSFQDKDELMGKFGSWGKSNLTEDELELFSFKNATNHILDLSKRTIINSTITLYLKLSPSYRTIFKIFPQRKGMTVLKAG